MAKHNTNKSKSNRTSKATTRRTPTKASAAPRGNKPAASKAAPTITATEAVKAAVAAEANARRRPAAGNLQPVITISRDEIAQRAYLIWLAKGKPQGQDEANWLEAEAELALVTARA